MQIHNFRFKIFSVPPKYEASQQKYTHDKQKHELDGPLDLTFANRAVVVSILAIAIFLHIRVQC